MKHSFLGMILSMIFILSSAQDNVKSKIVFDKTIYNFGIVDKGSKAECIFSFTNKSQSAIAIINIKASCGCTAPFWSKEPVEPNDSGEIKVKYNTNIIGAFIKTLTIYSSISKETITLTIKGEVKRKKKTLIMGSVKDYVSAFGALIGLEPEIKRTMVSNSKID